MEKKKKKRIVNEKMRGAEWAESLKEREDQNRYTFATLVGWFIQFFRGSVRIFPSEK